LITLLKDLYCFEIWVLDHEGAFEGHKNG